MISSSHFIISQLSSISVALLIGFSGYRKKSLDLSGALGAILVGYLTLRAGLFETIVLLFFFYSSSKLTKYKSDIKKRREDGFKEGEGHRNWEQVLANGGFPTAALLLIPAIAASGGSETSVPIFQIFSTYSTLSNHKVYLFLMSVFLGVYCANCGDTWSSEVGILSTSRPRFILAPWKQVPFGTNGGVSLKGFSAALSCGFIYGMITMAYMYAEIVIKYYLSSSDVDGVMMLRDHLTSPRYPVLFLTIFASLFGTVLDSVLGAIFEYSGFSKRKGVVLKQYDEKEDFGDNLQHVAGFDILTGCNVNYISGVITGLLTGLLALYIF